MGTSLIQRSFAAGELAPALHARADLARYLTGLRTCRNFFVRRHGGVANRSGFEFVAEAKAGGIPALHRLVFPAADASYLIEAGANYFRFHRNGAPVTVSSATAWSSATVYVAGDYASRLGVIYYCRVGHTNQQPPNATYWHPLPVVNGASVLEIPTVYNGGDFDDPARACLEQNGLRITITHLNRQPHELELLNLSSPPRFALRAIVTAPSIDPPANVTASAGVPGTGERRYVVTALKAETYEESNPSSVFVLTAADAPTEVAPNVISWDAVAGAAEYRVYSDPHNNGTFGFLGVATGQAEFRDVAQIPDFSLTPPIPRELFATENNYPAVNTTYQQRRIMAGTHIDREQIFASQVGYRSNFAIRSPLQDDDAVTFSIASNLIQPVMHLVGLQLGLVVLTDCGEHVIRGDENGTLLPRAINPRQHGYVGSNFVPPAIIGESVIFVQSRGQVLRDLRFDQRVEGLSGRDLCLYAAHLFSKSKRIVDLAYAQVPDSIVWCVREDGALLGLTYIRDEDVVGWHRHDTGAGEDVFKRVEVLPEQGEDYVYVVVQREVNNQTKTYIERMHSREFDELEDCFFVDSGKTFTSFSATTSITGLTHLATRSVVALVDGVKQGPFTVSESGTVTLTTAGRTVQIGLPITADLETLDLDINGSTLRDRRKLVKSLALLLENSARGFYAGPDVARLVLQRAEPHEAAGLITGRQEVGLKGTYNEYGRVLVRHTDPTPLSILGLLPHVEVGG
jgi:hypothetical protein